MHIRHLRFVGVLAGFAARLALVCLSASIWLPFSVEAQTGASAPVATPLITAPAIDKPVVPSDKEKSDKPAEPKAADKTPPITPHIALLVPSGSKVFGKVAEAVRQGFIAAAEADGKTAPPYRVYAADDEAGSMAGLYRKAVNDGAMAVVGGVTRDGAAVMVKEAGYLPTLALNAPPDMDLPDRFFYISLNLDWEAKMVARSAFEEGARRVAVVMTASPLAKRIQASFESEWIRQGGEISARIPFDGAQADGDRIRNAMDKFFDKESEKYKLDGVFLAADTRAARIARPYIPASVQVFATSHTLDARAGAVENLDLESVRFLEMPWFVEKDHPAVMVYTRPAADMPIDYERLYALGIDAWRIAQLIAKVEKIRDIAPLDGVTGRLTLDNGHQFIRKLSQVEMRDGRTQVYRPSE